MTRSTARAALTFAARAVLVFGPACSSRVPEGMPVMSFQTDETRPHFGAVIVAPVDSRGLAALVRGKIPTAEWQKILAVHAGDSIGLSMLGTYVAAHDTLRFEPSFPPIGGTRYTARFDAAALNARMGIPARSGTSVSIVSWMSKSISGASTTSVEAVYPTTDSVPMNLLRMYIQFTAPMTVGDGAERRVRLLDERGAVVDKAFLIAAGGQELWDGEHTRLTIFFDPGRIKRNLTPHEALGLPLREGHAYSLVIDSTWHDAHGLPLTHGYVKRFRVGPIDRTLPRTPTWHIVTPAVGTLDPVTIDLPEPLDHALLGRMLTVKKRGEDGARSAVAGRAATTNDDRRWTFVPSSPWGASAYDIEVDTELEDLAGNNLRHLFDVMPADSATRGMNVSLVRIPFSPRR